MEDIEASKRLKSAVGSEFLALTAPLVTSGRRWIEYGYTATILDMWRMRWRYFSVPVRSIVSTILSAPELNLAMLSLALFAKHQYWIDENPLAGGFGQEGALAAH